MALSVIVVGCTDQISNDPAPAAKADASANADASQESTLINDIYVQANDLFAGGNTNGALEFLAGALADENHSQFKAALLNMLVQMQISSGYADKAEALFFEYLASDPKVAADSAGALFDYYNQLGNNERLIAWTERVLAADQLPPAFRSAVKWWNWNGYISAKNEDKTVAIAVELLKDAPAGNALEILQRGIDVLINRREIATVDKILDRSAGIITSDKQTRDFLLYLKMRLFSVKGKWDAFKEAFPAVAAQLEDPMLERLIHREVPASKKIGQTAVADYICEMVLDKYSAKTRSMAEAARIWVATAADYSPEALPDRLSALLEKKMSADFAGHLFYRYFYNVIDNPAIVAEMLSVGEHILPAAKDEGLRGSIRTLLLDASFVLNDFDASLRYLEQGIPDQDKAWHDMAIFKVKAHRALAQNNPREAVEFFRKFMTVIAVNGENEQVDPSTGVIHTKDMILGRNAKRIGDILAAIPDKTAAATAYDEARAYYRKAIESNPDPDTLKVAEKEFAEIPK